MSRKKAQEAVDKRNNLLHEMRSARDRYQEALKGGDPKKLGEFKEVFERAKTAYQELDEEEKRELEADNMTRSIEEFEEEDRKPARAPIRPALRSVRSDSKYEKRQKDLEMRASSALEDLDHIGLGRVSGLHELDKEDREALAQIEKRAFNSWLKGVALEDLSEIEQRSLSAGNLDQGGTLAAPPVFASEVLVRLTQAVTFRQKARIVEGGPGTVWGQPTIEDDPEDPDWTSETASADEDTQMKTGMRQLTMHDLTKMIKLSLRIIRSSPHNVLGLVAERFAVRMAQTKGRAYMTGTGVGEPLGIFTNSTQGIAAARDVTAGFDLAAGTYIDGLKRLIASVEPQYHAGCWFFLHQLVSLEFWLEKDGVGRPIWQDNQIAGQPPTLLGFPVSIEKYAPSTIVSGSYFGAFGNPQFYQILDLMMPEVVLFDQLYRRERKFGWQIEDGGDGMPIFQEAWGRAKAP